MKDDHFTVTGATAACYKGETRLTFICKTEPQAEALAKFLNNSAVLDYEIVKMPRVFEHDEKLLTELVSDVNDRFGRLTGQEMKVVAKTYAMQMLRRYPR
jgi:hypothetical protein